MPTSELFSPNPSNTKWNARGEVGEKGLGKGMDSEKKVFINFGGPYAVVLIDQDAFPCGDCDAYFLQQSNKGKSIVFRISADGTGDRTYHLARGLPATAGYPCTLYYHAGSRSYNAAPLGWPDAPAV